MAGLNVLVILMIVATSTANLVSHDEVEDLFTKFVTRRLTEEETRKLSDVFEILRMPKYVTARSLENTGNARMTLDCLVCRSAIAALFSGVEEGHSDEALSESITVLCTSIGIESHDVCKGAVGLNMPILTYIIKNTPEATPRTFCGLILQAASDPNVCVYTDPRFEWQVDLPDPVTVHASPTTDTTPLTVAIITDAHLDPLYEPYGAAYCGQPTCCRKGQNTSQAFEYHSSLDTSIYEQTFIRKDDKIVLDLSVSQKIRETRGLTQTRFLPGRNHAPAGYWGDYRNCDTPIWAYDDVIDRIAETHQNVDVVYYIGDSIDHFVWETTYELINEMSKHVVDKIRSSFGDNVLVVPTIGNHESQPTNQFAPSGVTGDKINTTWLYEALADKWEFYLPEGAKDTLLERGEYSVLVRPGLRAISLNNNVAYKYNWWLVYDPLDAKKHLDWLVDELHKAELAGEKVHILTHIPPGEPDLTHTWTREYNRIVNRFASTITGEFNGHTHSDEFKIFYNPEGQAVRVSWGAGSATTYSNYNLNYKIATFDPVTYEPTNIVNYVYNLTEANLTPNRRPHWFQLYDLKQRFQLADLSPASMDNLVTRMVTDNKQLLDLYAAFFSKLSDNRWPLCNTDCKLDYLCRTVITVLWERQKCDELQALYYV
ncbi:sphingomyelin phosphodiesterase 1-like [Cydia strobilella]|uniref:sphingomyelin phosphodiesterase 1-like n=1 Tax=Cydia strobilella TaxID=1100964 RepID=UPI0030059BF2